jgi:hypothetical protein
MDYLASFYKGDQQEKSLSYVKSIYYDKPITMESYLTYKNFKRGVVTKSFKSRIDCMESANKIAPGLGMTESIQNICKVQNLQ